VVAEAHVVRRGGRGLCFCEVSVSADDGSQVALALVTYQL
jgi:acyl-coenzyme A thioesterase PaaI-like protein